jgi:3-(3-hydroxy-phenyl)propionate hydroxylase
MKKYDIIIVGLGPVGLFAANIFGQYGYKVLAIEQFKSRVHFPRAIALDSEIIRAVQSIGLLDKLLPVLRPVDGLRLINCKGELFANFVTICQDGHSAGNLFYQPELENLLETGLQRFSNVEIGLGWKFDDIEKQDEKRVTLTISNVETGEKQTIETAFLLGCDGANSAVRTTLGIEVENLNYEGHVLKIDVAEKDSTTAIPLEYVEQFCSATFPYIRMSGRVGHKRFEFPLIYDTNPQKETYEKKEKINELLTKVGQDPSTLDVEHVVLYQYKSVVTKSWKQGNILLAGDAAHLTPPFVGQGMCAGFRDIVNLSWKIDEIIKGVFGIDLLETYQSEREPNFREYLGLAIMVGNAYVSDMLEMPFPTPPDKVLATERNPIGDGFFSATKGSKILFPQTKIQVNGEELWSDDYFKKRWMVLSLDAINQEDEADITNKHILYFELTKELDTKGVLRAWLKKHGATCAFVRPDKYVFGTASNIRDLITMMKK